MDLKTIVITGGTGGIGMHTAIGLARHPSRPRIVVTGRSQARGAKGVEHIKQASGHGDVHLATGDLSRPDMIDTLGAELHERFGTIDVLINNAGMLAPTFTRTAEGIELDFAVNVLAPWRLTHALLPALEQAQAARVINVTGGLPNDALDPARLHTEHGFVALPYYSHTKRAMEAMTLDLSERMVPHGILVNIVYPGAASTAMTGAMSASALPWWMRPFWPMFKLVMQRDDGGKSAAKAARSSIWAALDPALDGVHGRYYDAKCRPAKLHDSVHNATHRAQVIADINRLAPA